MAQPRRIPETRSTVMISIRLTQRERDHLRRLSNEAGLTVSEYIRSVAL